MYISYLLYQSEHSKTTQQQREEDIQTGELAAEFGRLWQSLAHRRNGGRQHGFRPAPEIEMISDDCATCSGQRAA
jgi:hypothetical protein